jgi:hypothetical protein
LGISRRRDLSAEEEPPAGGANEWSEIKGNKLQLENFYGLLGQLKVVADINERPWPKFR